MWRWCSDCELNILTLEQGDLCYECLERIERRKKLARMIQIRGGKGEAAPQRFSKEKSKLTRKRYNWE